MYYIKTSIKTHCPQSLHTVVCSITRLQKTPSCSSPCTQTPIKTQCPATVFNHKTTKKSLMLEHVHPNFPQQFIQSQDNKKRPHTGACTCSGLSTKQCLQMQDSKRKHHAPPHALLIDQIFLL
jgi:hypothetical protein